MKSFGGFVKAYLGAYYIASLMLSTCYKSSSYIIYCGHRLKIVEHSIASERSAPTKTAFRRAPRAPLERIDSISNREGVPQVFTRLHPRHLLPRELYRFLLSVKMLQNVFSIHLSKCPKIKRKKLIDELFRERLINKILFHLNVEKFLHFRR